MRRSVGRGWSTYVVTVGEMATVRETETHETVLRLKEGSEGSETTIDIRTSVRSPFSRVNRKRRT